MKVVPVEDLAADLARYLYHCQTEGPIVITENGTTVAILLAPSDEEDLERLLLARSPRFRALLDQSRQSIEAGKGLSRDEFWRAVEELCGDEGESAKVGS
jgi:PHD/YefM family antitoxin component YafN of YafNO toxin-antitoxin module